MSPVPRFLAFFALAGFLSAAVAQDSPVLVGTVTKIIDGDTIDVQLSSGSMRVRFHGIDTPERGQPWEDESTAWLSKELMAKKVRLEPFEQDRYARMIGIVFLEDLKVDDELVRLGHAWAFRKYMRKKEDAYLCELEFEAREAKRRALGVA